MDPAALATQEAVVHLDHNAGTKTRLWTMARVAAELRKGLRLLDGWTPGQPGEMAISPYPGVLTRENAGGKGLMVGNKCM